MPKTWDQKFKDAKPPHVTVLEKSFGGIPAGTCMLVSSPSEISEEISKLKPGEFITMNGLRNRLANRHTAETSCPTSTSIYLRIVAEVNWDKIEEGAGLNSVVPFWRVVEPNGKLAEKLRCGSKWIAEQRSLESTQR
ncbi:MAG: hypothetical protein SFY68_06825 [Candidatus Sumerlaeia bacterium]|nr:hypothetical protein [Candidatus Sumerlaeia bacterium]